MISIIIPTYNRSQNLLRAVESILSCKGEFEVIVVDDNGKGTDCQIANENVLRKYICNNEIVYIKHQINMNGAAARNTGIEFATGEYITFLDDDDEFLPERILSLEKNIKKYNPDFLYTNVVVKNMGKYELLTNYKQLQREEYQKILLSCESFFGTGSNMVCRRQLVVDIGGFDSSYVRHQDLEFMLRFLEVTNTIVVIDQPLVIKNNDDRQNSPNIIKLEKVKNKYLSDFDYIVKRFSSKEQSIFKEKIYYDLLMKSINEKNKDLIIKYKNILVDLGGYSRIKVIKKYIRSKIRRLKITVIIRDLLVKPKYLKFISKNQNLVGWDKNA